MTMPAHASLESTPSVRRPWTAPQLTAHASMTVLTQSVLGVSDAMLLLQIGGSTGGVGGGNAGPSVNSAGQPVTTQGGASGPPRH